MRNVVGRAAWACLIFAHCIGCGDDSTPLARLQGKVRLNVGGTPGNFGFTVTHSDETLPDPNNCIVIDARASVNGVAVPQTDSGGSVIQWLPPDDPRDDPCEAPAWGINFDRVPSWLRAPVTEIRLSDDSASFSAEIENLATLLTTFIPNAGGALVLSPGTVNTVTLDPPVPGLATGFATLAFYPDSNPNTPTFEVNTKTGELVAAEDSVTFSVPAVPKASGWLVLTPELVEPSTPTCTGFSECGAGERSQHVISTTATLGP